LSFNIFFLYDDDERRTTNDERRTTNVRAKLPSHKEDIISQIGLGNQLKQFEKKNHTNLQLVPT